VPVASRLSPSRRRPSFERQERPGHGDELVFAIGEDSSLRPGTTRRVQQQELATRRQTRQPQRGKEYHGERRSLGRAGLNVEPGQDGGRGADGEQPGDDAAQDLRAFTRL